MIGIGIWFGKDEEGRSSTKMGCVVCGWDEVGFRLGQGFLGLNGASIRGLEEDEEVQVSGWVARVGSGRYGV